MPLSVAGLARRAELDPRLLGLFAAWVAIAAVLQGTTDGVFLSPRNLYNLAVQSSVVGVMACGMVLVITARHIDLSVGSLLGFTGMLVAWLQAEVLPPETAWGWPLSVAVGLAAGLAIGAWQGWWVAYRGVPAFVVTLAGLLMFRGAAWLVTDGRTVAPLDPGFMVLGGGLDGSIGVAASRALAALAIAVVVGLLWRSRANRLHHGFEPRPAWADALRGGLAIAGVLAFVGVMNAAPQPRSELGRGVPVPALLWAGTVVAVTVVARATRFGRYVYAIGGNPTAAARAGVDVRRVTLGVFVWMGGLAALGGIITAARLGAGANSMGTLLELSVIAAAVIGGTSLAGGRGSVPGAILGAVLMQSLDNGMVILGVSSAMRQVGIGALLLVAVFVDVRSRRGDEP